MTANGWIQIAIFTAILILLARPLGGYMTAVFEGRVGFLRPVERVFYALCGVDERQEQHWLTYGIGLLLFHDEIAGIPDDFSVHIDVSLRVCQGPQYMSGNGEVRVAFAPIAESTIHLAIGKELRVAVADIALRLPYQLRIGFAWILRAVLLKFVEKLQCAQIRRSN